MAVDVAAAREAWTGATFDEAQFEISEAQILAFSRSASEADPRFSDPSHPDFQAPPTFTAQFRGHRALPEDFPRFGSRGFDAGKSVEVHAPLRPGDRLTGQSSVHDIYEKTGRSGPMYFIVHRMRFTNQHGELVSIVDWRLVQQPGRRDAR